MSAVIFHFACHAAGERGFGFPFPQSGSSLYVPPSFSPVLSMPATANPVWAEPADLQTGLAAAPPTLMPFAVVTPLLQVL